MSYLEAFRKSDDLVPQENAIQMRHETDLKNGDDLPKRSPEIVTIFEGTISQRWYLRN